MLEYEDKEIENILKDIGEYGDKTVVKKEEVPTG